MIAEWGLLGGVKTILVLMFENAVGHYHCTIVASVEDAEANLKRWESYGGANNEFPRAVVLDMTGEPKQVAELRGGLAVYVNGQPVACPPIDAQEAIAKEIADGAAMGSVTVGGVTYSWD
jgi:hypothetical protein